MKINPGVKTSEFWVAIVLPFLVTVLNSIFGWAIDPQMILGMFGASGAYAVSRGIAKGGK